MGGRLYYSGVVLFALGFAGIVWLLGSLSVAMLVHLSYDITGGIAYGLLEPELGHGLEPTSTAAAQ